MRQLHQSPPQFTEKEGYTLSIITINYNNAAGLRRTLESVAEQSTRDFEYIVVDGGSTDGSVEVIKEFQHIITKWVSEEDSGIYNAMNKGTRMATGRYCQYLNSGDALYDRKVGRRALKALRSRPVDILTGVTVRSDGGISKGMEELALSGLIMSSQPHPSSYIRRELLLRYPYDENLRIVSDWKFFIEAVTRESLTYRRINRPLVLFDIEGVSTTQTSLVSSERHQVLDSLSSSTYWHELAAIPPGVAAVCRRNPNSYRFKHTLSKLTRCLERITRLT